SYSIQIENSSTKKISLDPKNSPIKHRSKNIFYDKKTHSIWVPSFHGIYQINLKTSKSLLYQCSGGIITALPTKNNQGDDIVLMGTHTNGVIVLNLKTLQLSKQIHQKDLDGDGILTQAYQSKDESIWLATNGRGVLHYSPYFNLFY